MFTLSKIFWIVAQPGNLLVFLLMVGAALLWTRRRRTGRWMVALAGLGLALLAATPAGDRVLRPLEARFPMPSELPAHIDGILVLGGAVSPRITEKWGQAALNHQAERLTAMLALAARYPDAKLVHSGGSGLLMRQDLNESTVTRQFLAEQGVDVARVLFEDRSRNTYENALFSKELLQPNKGEVWLLITSAFHMPRAMGIFRSLDWEMRPYPVDYQTDGEGLSLDSISLGDGVSLFDRAVREWLGLIAYRILGRTDALFPAPSPPA